MSVETPTTTPTLAKVEETYDAGTVEQLVVRMDGDDGHAVVLTASGTDAGVRLDRIAPVGTTSLSRELFALVAEGIAELHARADDVDLGAFDGVVNDGDAPAPASDPVAPSSLQEDLTPAIRERDGQRIEPVGPNEAAEEADVWCGICGDGPYQSLNIHHGRMHPDDEPLPRDEEPTMPVWCDAHPEHLLAESPSTNGRSLGEILDEVESQETVINIHKRLGATSLPATKRLLDGLGLLQPDETLHAEDILSERVAALREVRE